MTDLFLQLMYLKENIEKVMEAIHFHFLYIHPTVYLAKLMSTPAMNDFFKLCVAFSFVLMAREKFLS